MNEQTAMELAIMLAPNPTEDDISFQMKSDKMKNPHNDSHKPKLRDRLEIIIDYKIAAYKMMVAKAYK